MFHCFCGASWAWSLPVLYVKVMSTTGLRWSHWWNVHCKRRLIYKRYCTYVGRGDFLIRWQNFIRDMPQKIVLIREWFITQGLYCLLFTSFDISFILHVIFFSLYWWLIHQDILQLDLYEMKFKQLKVKKKRKTETFIFTFNAKE